MLDAGTAKVVLIAGVGQLGSRYLQGLSGFPTPLRIYLLDISASSLEQARLRWNAVCRTDSIHHLITTNDPSTLPRTIDLAVVSSRAHERPALIKGISIKSVVKFWIVEKVLAQSIEGLDTIVNSIKAPSKAWVNTPRRVYKWHNELKRVLPVCPPVTMALLGGDWGLACNSVHYLDFLSWLTGETVVAIDSRKLSDSWFEGKRSGNWEIFGTLEASFSKGSTLSLTAGLGPPTNTYRIHSGNLSYYVDEDNGLIEGSNGAELLGTVPLVSEITSNLVHEIFETGNCGLPTLQESAEIHRIFLASLLAHWQRHMDISATEVPIT